MGQYLRELNVAVELAKEAGNIVLNFYDKEYDVSFKGENDPVTQADKASNEYITSELNRRFPEDGILAEESQDNLSRLQTRRVWIVDPMDGTREFIDKVGQFAVMIGLSVEGHPVLGVVYQPTTDTMFTAVKGEGAFRIQNGKKTKLSVSDISEPSDMRLVVSRSHRSHLVDSIMQSLGIEKEVASGSVGLKVGLMVQNKSDIYIHPNSKTKEWDTCAPQIILEEAGGEITDCWGSPLTYNKENTYNDKGFVASNGTVHWQIVEHVIPFLDKMD